MKNYKGILNKIFTANEANFEELALDIFHFQYNNNSIYKHFVDYLKINPKSIKDIQAIPYMPIDFFKSHIICTNPIKYEQIFRSSGTTGQLQSQHFIKNTSIYKNSYLSGFNHFFGPPSNYHFIGLLPSYLERNDASLVNMVDGLMEASGQNCKDFFLYDFEKCIAAIKKAEDKGKKVFIIGVTFALLDLLDFSEINLSNHIVLETGGMKGKRKEIIREELHHILKKGFKLDKIHGEYGMTELLSQAYSLGDGIFSCPPWMKILIRDPLDPYDVGYKTKKGAINVIDLANIFSCSFIATSDIGALHKSGSFEVLGRMDNAELRGCNLMY